MQTMILRLPTQGLLRDAAHLGAGQGARLLIQAAYFILVARALGPDQYGAFVTAVALAAMLSPFSGLGTPNLFIKNVRSHKRAANLCWGNGLLLSIISGALLCALALGINRALELHVTVFVTLTVAVADLIFLKITELAAYGYTAVGNMKQTSVQVVAVSGLRLAGIVTLQAKNGSVPLALWALVYLLTTCLGALYAVLIGSRVWGRPQTEMAALREDAAEGVFFSIANSAATVYNDIDKVMLSRLGNLEATGVYAAAYRVIDVSITPIRSLAAAAYPQFFRKGLDGAGATYRYALSLIARTSIYGFVASAGLLWLAPVVAKILGPSYGPVAPAVRWLALIPFLRCMHSFMADALSGADRQPARTTIQVLVALVNIAANLVILPRYSWRGAAWSSLGCDALLVALFWSVASFYGRQPVRRVNGSLFPSCQPGTSKAST